MTTAPVRRTELAALGLAVLCVAQFVDVMSLNAAIVALPEIRGDLDMGAASAQWVVSGYALLFGGLLLFAGRLADRVGHLRAFTVGLVAFGAASLLCAAAPSGAVLVFARVAAGAAAALTVPGALALLVADSAGPRRRRALAWWTAAGAGGGIAGVVLGGLLTDLAGWRAAFVVPGVLALACLPFVRALAPAARPGADRPLDVAGAVAGIGGLVLLLAALGSIGEGGATTAAWAAVGAAGLAFAGFAAIEARVGSPLLPRGLTAQRPLLAGTLASTVNTAATSPLAVLGAIYLQDVRDWSPAANGLAFVPFSAMVVAGSAAGAALLGRIGPRRTLAVAAVPLAGMPLVACTVAADGGFAAGLINTATQLGTAIGVALLAPLAAAVGDTLTGLRVGFAATPPSRSREPRPHSPSSAANVPEGSTFVVISGSRPTLAPWLACSS